MIRANTRVAKRMHAGNRVSTEKSYVANIEKIIAVANAAEPKLSALVLECIQRMDS